MLDIIERIKLYIWAINYIINVEPLIKVKELERTGENYIYDLKELFAKDNYKQFYNINTEYPVEWELLTRNLILINEWKQGKIDIYFEIYPNKITGTTATSTELELEEEFVRLIPLYIAGELYKDDDLTLSTMYMTEFMTNLNSMIDNDIFINNSIKSSYRMEM